MISGRSVTLLPPRVEKGISCSCLVWHVSPFVRFGSGHVCLHVGWAWVDHWLLGALLRLRASRRSGSGRATSHILVLLAFCGLVAPFLEAVHQ
jgi:hypothetical protein